MSVAIDLPTSDLKALGRGQAAGDGFFVATLIFHRARQLKAGARPRVDSRGHTVVRVAFLEVRAGLVTGGVPDVAAPGRTHEEL